MLARLEDCIFEGLPNGKAMAWPIRFMEAVKPGADLSRVGWQFLHWVLTDKRVNPGIDHPLVKDAVRQCADVLNSVDQRRKDKLERGGERGGGARRSAAESAAERGERGEAVERGEERGGRERGGERESAAGARRARRGARERGERGSAARSAGARERGEERGGECGECGGECAGRPG